MSTRLQEFRARIDRAKALRRQLIPAWQTNVAYRTAKPFAEASDNDRVAVTMDHALTKAKAAQLFSQVPEVRLTPKHPAFAGVVPVFQKALNEVLTAANVGTALDEVLPDCINAAGIGVVLVSYEAQTEPVDVPAIDLQTLPPDVALALMRNGDIPMERVERVIDQRYVIRRVSPSDFLWPVDFTGSSFDDAPWIGRSGRMTWPEAQRAFSLADADKERVTGGGRERGQDRLSKVNEQDVVDADLVEFDEIYYKRTLFHTDEKYYDALHRVVFVSGLEEPVVDEPWRGQRFDSEAGRYVGACRDPIRVLTLTYISDDPIPPSDSAIGRPQVDELIRSRSQMIQQREHSVPVRWMDVNRVDPEVQANLQRGDWQGFIPIQGDGGRAIGEVARAQYPAEDFEFDKIAKRDLHEAWGSGPNTLGQFASGERSATEAAVIQSNFATRMGYERARVVALFVSIAEVTAGLMALNYDFHDALQIEPDLAQRLQAWDPTRWNHEVVFTIRADSTVLLDSNQRLSKVMQAFNYLAKSPFVSQKPIIEEIVILSGLDPTTVVVDPPPPVPESPNISYRFSGDDLSNPTVIAMLLKAGVAPTPQEMVAARALIANSSGMTPPPASQAPVGPPPQQPPPTDQFPDWVLADRLNKRTDAGDLG